MCIYNNKMRFIFCTKEEAKVFQNEVDKLNNYHKGKDDFSFYCDDYDDVNKGIMVSYSKRNCDVDDFRWLARKYKSYYMVNCDGEIRYTNDYNHEIFPKYIVNCEDFNNVDEIINYYREDEMWSDEEVEEFKSNFDSLHDYIVNIMGVIYEEVFDDYLVKSLVCI